MVTRQDNSKNQLFAQSESVRLIAFDRLPEDVGPRKSQRRQLEAKKVKCGAFQFGQQTGHVPVYKIFIF